MMRVLFLVSALVSAGLADDMKYGSSYSIRLQSDTYSLSFRPYPQGGETILWKRNQPVRTRYGKFGFRNNHFIINKLTPADDGEYRQKGRDNNTRATQHITVEAEYESFTRMTGESFFFYTYNVPSSSCNIYHTSGLTSAIMKNGMLEYIFNDLDCNGMEDFRSCGINIESVQKGCEGKYTIRDKDGYDAMVVELTVEVEPLDISKIGIGIGVSFATLFCCGCMKSCCCGKKKKKNQDEASEEEPAVHFHEHEQEPAGRRPEAIIHNPEINDRPPAYTAAGHPLIHSFPVMPPSYSELTSTEDTPQGPATFTPTTSAMTSHTVTTFTPTSLPLSSDPEPRFQIDFRGPSALPLSSDTEFSSVYTSDKLNFGSQGASD